MVEKGSGGRLRNEEKRRGLFTEKIGCPSLPLSLWPLLERRVEFFVRLCEYFPTEWLTFTQSNKDEFGWDSRSLHIDNLTVTDPISLNGDLFAEDHEHVGRLRDRGEQARVDYFINITMPLC